LCCIELFVLAIVAARAAYLKRRQALTAADASDDTTTTELIQQDGDETNSSLTESLLKHETNCCLDPPNHQHEGEHPIKQDLLSQTCTSRNQNEIVAVGVPACEGTNCGGVDNP
jgi:hypothetical protein